VSEPAEEAAPSQPETEAPLRKPRRFGMTFWLASALSAVIVIAVIAIAATPFWAPPVIGLLPWGQTAPGKPQPSAAEPDLAALKTEAGRNAAVLQQLSQRIAALESRPAPDLSSLQQLQQRVASLEARPAPDLSAVQQHLAALDKSTGDLGDKLAALAKAEQQQSAVDPKLTALALTLLQIRDAVAIGRPFDAEYRALVTLAHDHPDIASAAAPLADPAESGVASRAALIERLRQLAPQIATAHPPPKDKLKSQIIARLRSLVTIRRIDDDGDQTPAEAAVGEAQRDLASGDLAGAVAALDKLDGPAKTAAEPWLKTAKARLAVETALHQVEIALTASLGNAAPAASGRGG
jgi:hypothetical protein